MEIEIEGETLANLMRIVRNCTERLHDGNFNAFKGKVINMPCSNDRTLENLRDHLNIQRSILDFVA